MYCTEPEVEVIDEDQNELTGSYTFDQLSDKAKAAACDQARDWNVTGHDWWDFSYEDAVRMGALMGIYVGTRDKTGCNIDINFSRGDGASFAGNYKPKADAVKNIEAECNDGELLRIAEKLAVLQVTAKLSYDDQLEATISYYRSQYSISVDVWAIGLRGTINQRRGYDDNEITPTEEMAISQLMRDFADWIYNQLKAEYDYLTSDECIENTLREYGTLFDGDGTII